MDLKGIKTSIKNKSMMKSSLFALVLTTLMFSCSGITDITNTKWIGVEKDGNTSIVFNDSTCEIYKRFETGYIDTIKASYTVCKDTVSIVPFSESVTVGSNLIITGKELKDSKSGTVVFKLKEQ